MTRILFLSAKFVKSAVKIRGSDFLVVCEQFDLVQCKGREESNKNSCSFQIFLQRAALAVFSLSPIGSGAKPQSPAPDPIGDWGGAEMRPVAVTHFALMRSRALAS